MVYGFLGMKLADAEGIPSDRRVNDRLRGVSRMESLAIILEKSAWVYTEPEKMALADKKNNTCRALLAGLSPGDILPGVNELLEALRTRRGKLEIGSYSNNTGPILQAIGLDRAFDTVVDGTHIARSKPDPEVFTLAAKRLGVPPARCLVVEDEDAGVGAGLAAGMRVLAVGSAASHPGPCSRFEARLVLESHKGRCDYSTRKIVRGRRGNWSM